MPTIAHQNWRRDRGDETLIFDYPLNENSFVIELGAYQGLWTKNMLKKFDCRILSIEPIPSFYKQFVNSLSEEQKQKLILENCAITPENTQVELFVSHDASSIYQKNGEKIVVDGFTMQHLFNKHNISKVELIQINIEGEEYSLLENWIENDFIKKFKFVQVQFHTFVENYVERRNKIQENLLSKNFKQKYNYDFVWESWENLSYE